MNNRCSLPREEEEEEGKVKELEEVESDWSNWNFNERTARPGDGVGDC